MKSRKNIGSRIIRDNAKTNTLFINSWEIARVMKFVDEKLVIGAGWASLDGLQVIWRDGARGRGGQFGAAVAFSPDKKFLFLSVGDRQRMTQIGRAHV